MEGRGVYLLLTSVDKVSRIEKKNVEETLKMKYRYRQKKYRCTTAIPQTCKPHAYFRGIFMYIIPVEGIHQNESSIVNLNNVERCIE